MWPVVGVTMWRRMVLYMSSLLLADCVIDYRVLGERWYHAKSQVSCVEYPDSRFYDGGWRYRDLRSVIDITKPTYQPSMIPVGHIRSRRYDRYFPKDTDLVKEHAKLVQDINSLRQIVFVAPQADESRDYEDSIFPELIETYTATTHRPTTTRTPKPTKGIPLILLGGASQRQIVRSQPIKFPKQVINLVGTSVSPLYKHPYPFVMQASSRQPVKICVTAPPLVHTTTRRPSLWERLINSIIPRNIIGASRPNLLPI